MGGALFVALAETFAEISEQRLQELCSLGALYHEGQRVRPEQFEDPVASQSYFRLHTQPRRFPEVPDLRSKIIFEDEAFIVIDKPHGLPTHATVDNRQENLLYLLEKEFGERIYITHRLDVPTAGLMVYAKSTEAQEYFNKQIRSGAVNKSYLAQSVVPKNLTHLTDSTCLPSGLIRHYMQPSARGNKTVSKNLEAGWQECLLKIKSAKISQVLNDQGATPAEVPSMVKVAFTIELITGRTHQIRAQLSALGFPILGDLNYGGAHWSNPPFEDSREQIALWSTQLNFKNLYGQELSFELPQLT